MDGTVIIGTELDTKNFDQQIEDVSNKLQDIEDQLSRPKELGLSSRDVTEMKVEAEKLSNKLVDLRKKQKDLDNPPSNFLKGLKSVGNETNKIINKVGRWALAVFGVRSAYMFIRQAMSTLSQYDDQMATNVEYIRYLLASALKPVIENLINLAYQLLQYLNMIAQAWFGINLFANATTEEFMKQQKAMKGTGASAKELKKTLAGFDEMNILQEDGSTKVGGGGGGITMPNLPSMENVEIPEWMQWIIDHKDEIIAGLTGIATAIGLINLGVGLFMSFGIGLIVAGLAYAILAIIDYLNDPSFENFGKTIQGIGGAIVGLGVVAGSVFAGLVGGVVLIWGTVIKYWTEIQQFLSGIYDWIEESIGAIEDVFGTTAGNIWRTIVESGRNSLQLFGNVIKGMKEIFNGFIDFFTGIFTGDWSKAWNGLKQIGEGALNILVSFALGVWDNLLSIINIGINGLKGGIATVINGIIGATEGIINGFIDAFNGIAGFLDMKKAKPVHFGRIALAKGGIVNMPGRGVPVGSAIAGERGQEAVLPLTDSQQMELLGQSIGKYITINANITTTMNGRVISKELQKIQAENDFAYNR